jgi:hypothetical protein
MMTMIKQITAASRQCHQGAAYPPKTTKLTITRNTVEFATKLCNYMQLKLNRILEKTLYINGISCKN